MTLTDQIANFDRTGSGQWMHDRIRALFPICRSITGDGVRETLHHLAEFLPLEIHEVPSGTPVFDWTIPQEWNIRDGYLANAAGERVVDFQACNLHVMGYSEPVRTRMTKAELSARVHTLPGQPGAVPHRTSFYKRDWAFSVAHAVWEALPDGEYEVCIDSTLEDGSLTYAECILPGEGPDTVLISSHVCHPSLANDNLSGVAVAAQLARLLRDVPRRHTYRFVFAPGTIGAITWLAQHQEVAPSIAHGLILACVGDPGALRYKQSRRGDAVVDRAVAHVFTHCGERHTIQPFIPYGYDERQYCSPGFNLPVGCFMRSGPGGYPEYHTSGDNLALVRPECLADSLEKILDVIQIFEQNATYQNLFPHCEPQLGRRGLYGAVGGRTNTQDVQMALLWVLNYSDGQHDLLYIAEKSGMSFKIIRTAADALLAAELLAPL
jgi:aminopeptidase-like protein